MADNHTNPTAADIRDAVSIIPEYEPDAALTPEQELRADLNYTIIAWRSRYGRQAADEISALMFLIGRILGGR
jgi:hypothetical protein